MFHVYVIVSESHPDRYYIGFSSRPDDRLTEHNGGKNPSTADTNQRPGKSLLVGDHIRRRRTLLLLHAEPPRKGQKGQVNSGAAA
jgi:predicted GIY-YIG superfamily endonuclease